MKKIISLSVFIFCLSVVYSQTSDFVLTAKDSALAKVWKVKQYERFGTVETDIPQKEANDGLTLMLDQTAFFTYDGVVRTGKWTTDKSKTTITVTEDTPAADGKKLVHTFRIVKGGSEELVVKYQDKELISTIYTLVPKK